MEETRRRAATDGKESVQKSTPGQYDGIRLFKVEQATAEEPLREVKGAWTEAKKETVMGFSATLFFFGESLKQRQPDVPLGLIRSSVGATNAFSWIPNDVRDTDESTAYLREWWSNATKGWTPEKQAERDQQTAAYEEQVAAYRARNEKTDSLKNPGELMGPKYSRRPSALYNDMIAPLQPVAVRGVIWYQGEWDSKKDWVKVYRGTLAALAKSWRANWAKAAGDPSLGDFPFISFSFRPASPVMGTTGPSCRDYARFGAFFKTTLEKDQERMLKFRFIVLESVLPPAGWIQKQYNAYAGVKDATPETMEKGPS